jgi:hypothetical protein
MDPDPGKRRRLAARVDLGVEELGDGRILKGDARPVARLGNELHVLDEQQVVARRDPEPADLRGAGVT